MKFLTVFAAIFVVATSAYAGLPNIGNSSSFTIGNGAQTSPKEIFDTMVANDFDLSAVGDIGVSYTGLIVCNQAGDLDESDMNAYDCKIMRNENGAAPAELKGKPEPSGLGQNLTAWSLFNYMDKEDFDLAPVADTAVSYQGVIVCTRTGDVDSAEASYSCEMIR